MCFLFFVCVLLYLAECTPSSYTPCLSTRATPTDSCDQSAHHSATHSASALPPPTPHATTSFTFNLIPRSNTIHHYTAASLTFPCHGLYCPLMCRLHSYTVFFSQQLQYNLPFNVHIFTSIQNMQDLYRSLRITLLLTYGSSFTPCILPFFQLSSV